MSIARCCVEQQLRAELLRRGPYSVVVRGAGSALK